MTLRHALLALAFAGVFLIGLLVFAPASLMGYALERFSGGTLLLAQTSGSAWHGSGVAVLRQKARYRMLGSYRWDLHLFRAALQIQAGEAAPMTVRYNPIAGRISVDDLHLALPASIMEVAAPQLVPYQLDGTLEAHSNHLTLDAAGMNGQVTMDWARAGSGLSEIRPLGDYRIQLHGNGSGLDAQLSTLSGKLQLTVAGSFDKTNGMLINGTAQAASAAAAQELNELLHHMGPEISPGVFTLALMPQPSTTRLP